MYEPQLGRFLARDPLPENGVEVLYPFPDMTKYAYVGNNPTNRVDPSGADYSIPGDLCLPCFQKFTKCINGAGNMYAACVAGNIVIPSVLGLTCVGLCNVVKHPVGKILCRAACVLGNLGILICYLGYICPDWLEEAEMKCINDYNRCKHADPLCRRLPDIRPK